MNDDEERKRKAREYARIIVKAKIIENLCSAKGPTVTDSSYRPVIDFHLTPHQLSQFMMSQVIFINYVTVSDNNTVISQRHLYFQITTVTVISYHIPSYQFMVSPFISCNVFSLTPQCTVPSFPNCTSFP